MNHMTASTAHKDFSIILDYVIKQGDTVSIATEDGAAVLVNQDEWRTEEFFSWIKKRL